jgi:hypothetical protein
MARLEDARDFVTMNSSDLADGDMFYVYDESTSTVKTITKAELSEIFGVDAVSNVLTSDDYGKVLKTHPVGGYLGLRTLFAGVGIEVGEEDGGSDGYVKVLNTLGAGTSIKPSSSASNFDVTCPAASGTISLQGKLLTGYVTRTITEADDGAMIAQANQINLPAAPTKALSFKWLGTDIVIFCSSGIRFVDVAGTTTDYTDANPFDNVNSPLALDFAYIGNRWVVKQIY